MANSVRNKKAIRIGTGASAGILLGLVAASYAHAFPIKTGNDDIVINLDNNLRVNAGWRAKDRDPAGPGSTASRDEGEFIFDKGDMINKSINLFSEIDVAFKNKVGFRVSGSAWFNDAYGNFGKSNPAFAAIASYPGNAYSSYVRRYYHGPSAEINDAFVWTNLELPTGTANVKAGRFAMLWGEAVFGIASANSVAAGMAPTDGQKSAISPGATAKETLLPIGQISASIPLADNLDISALYTYEYRASRISEGGTYFGNSDAALNGPVVNYAGTTALFRANPLEGDKGDIGLMLRHSPSWFDGTLGLVYRKYDDKNLAYSQASVPGRFYRTVANTDISLYGLTVGTSVAGMSVGAELSYRKGMGLAGSLDPISLRAPRGNTVHALVNATKAIGKTPVWDTASLVAELSWTHLRKVTEGAARYTGNTAACANEDITAGCPTKNAWHAQVSFNPSWQQVLPSVDLSAPMSLGYGLKGNAAASGSAINQGSATYSLGLSATLSAVHTFALTYTGYAVKHRGTGATFVSNGGANYDKNWVGLSYQTNF